MPAKRGLELVENIQMLIHSGRYTTDDVAFACALLAGHALAQGSGDNPEAFAKNVELTRSVMNGQAQETFGGGI